MLSYPVRLAETPEGKKRVIFLDVPEAVAEAGTEAEALFQARFALELSLGHYVMHGREIPSPSKVPEAPTVTTEKFALGRGEEAEAGKGSTATVAEAATAPGGGRY